MPSKNSSRSLGRVFLSQLQQMMSLDDAAMCGEEDDVMTRRM